MKKRKKKKIRQTIQKSASYFILCVIGFVGVLLLLIRENNVPKESNTMVVSVSENERLRFFDTIKVIAQQNQHDYGVLASITMAQAALESNYGTSGLATNYYNLFGVKGTSENGVLLSTLEYYNGQYVEIKDYFVVYPSWEASIIAHGQLLYYGTPWNSNQYRDVIIAKNYYDQALGLVTGGYATDPNYATKLVQMIEQYSLYQYDVR